MTGAKLDWLNTGLILVSFLLAVVLPFELFVFSYVVLGPLHYFTEIGWLHERQFFVKEKNDYLWLAGICLLTTLAYHVSSVEIDTIRLVLAAVVCAIILVVVKSSLWRFILVPVALIGSLAFPSIPLWAWMLLAFIPNLIHVFLFTWMFMLQGALRNRTLPSMINLLLLLLVGGVIMILPSSAQFETTAWAEAFIVKSGFENLRVQMTDLGFSGLKSAQVFLAFAYTYHYANWFSKTGIIGWHKIPKRNLLLAVILWIVMIALYFVLPRISLTLLFFFSLLHVFLEFPLNVQSGKSIFSSIFQKRISEK